MLKLNRKIPTILWGFFILYLTLKPKLSHGNNFPKWLENLHPDKIAHFGFWALWYFIFHYTFIMKQDQRKSQIEDSTLQHSHFYLFKREYSFIAMSIFCGAIIEVLQFWLNWGRSAEWLDLLCDSLGVLAVFLMVNFCRFTHSTHKKSS